MNYGEMMSLAVEAREKAYAPYSDFRVGAALLTESGKVYLGCNIENAAFTPTCCAERTAFFTAIASGERSFKAIAVVGGKGNVISEETFPCGVCRQVMVEFCDKDFVILTGTPDTYKSRTLEEVMPFAFSAKDI